MTWLRAPMNYNAKIWRVAIPFLNGTNVVKLPNPHNSIHNALRSASLNPESKKWQKAQKPAEWAVKRASCTEGSNSSVGHSPYRLLSTVYFFLFLLQLHTEI